MNDLDQPYHDIRSAYETLGAALNDFEKIEAPGDKRCQQLIEELSDAQAYIRNAQGDLE